VIRQFDVFVNPSELSRTFAPYVVLLQSHLLDVIDTVIVAPAIRDAESALSPFDVRVTIADETLFIAVSEMSSVEKRHLTRPSMNVVVLNRKFAERSIGSLPASRPPG
jgi:hypothetical protein